MCLNADVDLVIAGLMRNIGLDIQILRMQGLMSDKSGTAQDGLLSKPKHGQGLLQPRCVCLLSSVTCNKGFFSVFSSSIIAVHIPPYERMELNTCMLLITQRR